MNNQTPGQPPLPHPDWVDEISVALSQVKDSNKEILNLLKGNPYNSNDKGILGLVYDHNSRLATIEKNLEIWKINTHHERIAKIEMKIDRVFYTLTGAVAVGSLH